MDDTSLDRFEKEGVLPEGYQNTLLFISVKEEEEYRKHLAWLVCQRRRRRAAVLREMLRDENAERPPAAQIVLEKRQLAPPPTPSDLERLKILVRNHPDAVREVLAPVILDIVEEYLKEEPNGLAEESRRTQEAQDAETEHERASPP